MRRKGRARYVPTHLSAVSTPLLRAMLQQSFHSLVPASQELSEPVRDECTEEAAATLAEFSENVLAHKGT